MAKNWYNYNFFKYNVNLFYIIMNLYSFVLAIYTAAVEMLAGADSQKVCRKPDIVSDAAYALMCRDSKKVTGNFFLDEDILKQEGITDFTQYACDPGTIYSLNLFYYITLYLLFIIYFSYSKYQKFDVGCLCGH